MAGKDKKKKIVIEITPDDTYQEIYRLRRTGAGGASFETTLPKTFIEKQARTRGLTVDEFMKHYRVQAAFNSFRGIHLDFIEVQRKKD